MMEKRMIGRKERVSLPELELKEITAKIDTGAYTSSIHVESVRVEEELLVVCFEKDGPSISFPKWTAKKVRSSNGQLEERYLIETAIEMGRQVYPIALTLTDRADMKYPILLGRKILNHNFIVDSSRSFIL